MKKSIITTAALLLSMSMSFTSLAGQWKQDEKGWWYQNDDGSYPKNQWFQDADGKSYYFGDDGYMLTNTTTPDGYYVNKIGEWIKNAPKEDESSEFDNTVTIEISSYEVKSNYTVRYNNMVTTDKGDKVQIISIDPDKSGGIYVTYKPIEIVSGRTRAHGKVTGTQSYKSYGNERMTINVEFYVYSELNKEDTAYLTQAVGDDGVIEFR